MSSQYAADEFSSSYTLFHYCAWMNTEQGPLLKFWRQITKKSSSTCSQSSLIWKVLDPPDPWETEEKALQFAWNWRFCIQMCTVYCIYNVISIHHPNRITIYEMYLFTGGESGRRAGWPRSRSDGEHHGEAAPSLLTNGLPSNLRRPVRPPSDQVEDLALLPSWWFLSFCIFIFYFFHPGYGDATSSTGNPFFANQFYPFQPGFSGHKMASDPLSRFLWLFSLKLLLLFSIGRPLQKGGMPWMRAVCNSRLNLTLSYLLQSFSLIWPNEISQN